MFQYFSWMVDYTLCMLAKSHCAYFCFLAGEACFTLVNLEQEINRRTLVQTFSQRQLCYVPTVNQEANHDTVCFLGLCFLRVNASLTSALEPCLSTHTLSLLVNNLFYWLQCDSTVSGFSTAEHSCSCWLLIPYVSSKLYNSLF